MDFFFNQNKDWFIDILRTVFAWIDSLVYTIVTVLFRSIFNLANFELIGLYESFEERVYVILGIFMLFKVTISLITYLVNPDKITDKEQGVSKIVVRIIIVLVMLIALPTFFSLMTELQNKLLPVIPRVIVGTANTLESDDVTGIANNMSLTMLQGFAQLNDGCTGASQLQSVGDLVDNINLPCSDTNTSVYAYRYMPIVSTLVGVLACYVLFSLAISVAIRAFKLIILRMIAPVPVMSYIDPKSAKDGAFSHWIKTFISTWAELFINLAIIYFIVYIIEYLLKADFWKEFFESATAGGDWAVLDSMFLLAFLIIGLLFFAKSAPQFVFDALGIKTKGNFMRMLGMGANALAMGGSIASQLATRNRENPGHAFTNFGASLFSGLAHGAAGGHALLSTDKPTWHTGVDQIGKQKAIAISDIEGKSTLGDRLLSRAGDILGIPTKYDEDTRKIKAYEGATAAWNRIDTALNSDDKQIFQTAFKAANGDDIFKAGQMYSTKDANDILERMRSSGLYSTEDIEQVEEIRKSWQKQRFDNIRTRGADGEQLYGTEAQIFAATETIYNTAKMYANEDDRVFKSFKDATSVKDASLSMGGNFKAASYNASRQAEVVKNDPEYQRAEQAAKRKS